MVRGRKKGYKHSEETKKKIKETLKGRHVSPKTEFKKGINYSKKRKKSVRINGYNSLYAGPYKRIYEHHLVWIKTNQLHRIPDGCMIHHLDGNKLNNNLRNLQLMTRDFHMKIHNLNK